jgi:hypothetical protein
MDWWILLIVAIGAYFLWQHRKRTEMAKKANARRDRDTQLLQHIKSAKREYDFQKRDEPINFPKDGELVFETAHYSIYKVNHFAESRLGFHFKDIEEYGLYGFFAGEPGEYYDSYCRTDSAFKTEQTLVTRDA